MQDMDKHKLLKALIEGDYGDCEQTPEEEVREK